MNKEYMDLDQRLNGIQNFSFANLNGDGYNRKNFQYTWNDFEFNINPFPFQADTAIIVTSYQGQLGWLKTTLTNYRKTGAYVILAYDNPCHIWNNLDDESWFIKNFPRPIHYLLAHSVVVKHKTYDADKRTGWFWDVKYAQSIVNGFKNIKYVYCTNGDCIIERPQGLNELKDILGDGDLISGQSMPGGTIHTANVFYKVEAFKKIMNYMSDRMQCSVMASQSPEALLRDAVTELKLNEVFAEQPIIKEGPHAGTIDYYCTLNLDSTWKRVLGFRNLYGEFEYRENNGLEPLPAEYLDPYRDWMYFRDDWRATVCKYYETKDRRYLMMFWDRGKDSDYERKFLELEEYGKEPIYA